MTAGNDRPKLSVRGLVVNGGGRRILDDVSFEAERGEVVALIGPNGAGKTTLLEAIVGLRVSAAGTVHFGHHGLRTFGDRAATFAFAPDEVTPPSEVTVRTLVEHARAHRARPAGIVERLSRELGVPPLLDRPMGVLSRGERKRVALLVALAADRPVLVLDEPFATFDPIQLRDVLNVVRGVAREGAAVVVSVHQLADAEKVADRALLLANGRRIAFGTLEELRGRAGLPAGSLEALFVALLSRRAPDAA